MKNNRLHYKNCQEQGHITFYALFLIPFTVTFSILAFDIAGWQELREQTQAEADRLALYAVQMLPDEEHALRVVEEAVNSSRFALQRVEFSPGAVQVQVSAEYQASFDQFLNAFRSEPEDCSLFCVSRNSSVQLVPGDYIVVLADGSSQRPAVGELPWEDAVNWPASGFWECSGYLPSELIEGDANDTYDWSDQQLQRWATQACFNPVLSKFKLAAISLTETLGRVATNRVGVILTPGNSTGENVSFLRRIRGADGGFSGADSALGARWVNYTEPELGLGNEACALFSYPDWEMNYLLSSPGRVTGLDCELLSFPQCDFGQDALGRLTQCYVEQQLSLSEALYWNSAKLPQAGFNAQPAILDGILRAVGELVPVENQQIVSGVEQRGSLGFKARRQIIVLTDQLPSTLDPRVSDILANLQAIETELLLVAVAHQALEETAREELLSNASAFAALGKDARAHDSGKKLLQVFQAADLAELNQQIVPKLIVLGREVAIRN